VLAAPTIGALLNDYSTGSVVLSGLPATWTLVRSDVHQVADFRNRNSHNYFKINTGG
jgi:hypothetical protein